MRTLRIKVSLSKIPNTKLLQIEQPLIRIIIASNEQVAPCMVTSATSLDADLYVKDFLWSLRKML